MLAQWSSSFLCPLSRGALAALALLAIVPAPSAAATATLVPSPEPDWPQFRGPRRDGISPERNLLGAWPEGGPKLLWKTGGLGRGFSSPIVVKDRIYITGDVGNELHVFALDRSGNKLWTSRNGAAWTGDYPGARATPAFAGGRLYHANAHGRVACLDADSGREIWAVDTLREFGGKNITWALSECLAVDETAVYATPGGSEALLVALNPATGAVLWKSEPLKDAADGQIENAAYASPILVQFANRRLLIGCSLRNLFCADATNGKLQWTYRFPTSYSVLAAMPALVGDAVFMTAPHGRGGRLLRLTAPQDAQSPVGYEEVWTTNLDTCQGALVHVGDKLFGSFYGPRKGWAALDIASGRILYQAPELIKGAAIYADERLYVLSENGWMHLLQPGASSFEKRGEFRLAEARNDAWAHPVIHDGRLYLRYHDSLHCYDLRNPAPAPQ